MATGSTIPVVMGESREPPNYGSKYSESASRKCFASYREYVKYVQDTNEVGVLRRKLLTPKQLIPLQIQRVSSRRHADDAAFDNEQLCWLSNGTIFIEA